MTFIDEAPKKVADVLVEAYIKGIEYSHGKETPLRLLIVFSELIRAVNYLFLPRPSHRSADEGAEAVTA